MTTQDNQDAERAALKPCPFCGDPVSLELTHSSRHEIYGMRDWYGVKCRNTINRGGTCAIEQVPSASPEAAIERWNRRAPTPAEVGADADLIAAGALRQFRHNNDISPNPELVFAYDKTITDREFARLRAALSRQSATTVGVEPIDERYEFERHMSQRGDATEYIGDGMYSSGCVQDQWEAWLARAQLIAAPAHTAAPIADMKEKS